VVPSRAESLPYIVIESIAAGKQVIATDVGGIAEIFGPTREALVAADDADALAIAMRSTLEPRSAETERELETRYAYLAAHFHVDTMVDRIADTYQELANAD
jgi:glycosyltransferase involved in cell wall biosynthesis